MQLTRTAVVTDVTPAEVGPALWCELPDEFLTVDARVAN
jgi:hypothetical protein